MKQLRMDLRSQRRDVEQDPAIWVHQLLTSALPDDAIWDGLLEGTDLTKFQRTQRHLVWAIENLTECAGLFGAQHYGNKSAGWWAAPLVRGGYMRNERTEGRGLAAYSPSRSSRYIGFDRAFVRSAAIGDMFEKTLHEVLHKTGKSEDEIIRLDPRNCELAYAKALREGRVAD